MPALRSQQAERVFREAKPKEKEYAISDGKGLSLVVSPDGAKYWDFRYTIHGRRRKIAIKGGYPGVGVAVARKQAQVFRDMVTQGIDPLEERKAGREREREQEHAEQEERAKAENTFQKVALEWFQRTMDARTPGYSKDTWRRLDANVFPKIGRTPIADLKPPDFLAPLRQVEERGARESAHRILSVCGQICRFAVASGLLVSDPTRDLRGALQKPVGRHFPSFTEPEKVVGLLRAIEGYQGDTPTRIALRLLLLTFVRPGNLRCAEWSEFHDLDNLEKAEWRIPGEKMKVRKAALFVVPLAPQAVRLVQELRPLTCGRSKYLFPSVWSDEKPMSNNTINSALRRMGFGQDEFTGHGARAMARTLCHEVLGFSPEVIEEQLAHGKAGPLGGAYDRTTHMPERRRLMREWAGYLEGL